MSNPTLLQLDAAGNWAPSDSVSLDQLVGGTYATRSGWGTVASVDDALDRLARGFVIRYGREWFECVKRINTPAEIEALRARRAAGDRAIAEWQRCAPAEH